MYSRYGKEKPEDVAEKFIRTLNKTLNTYFQMISTACSCFHFSVTILRMHPYLAGKTNIH